jgi:two-component system chemotaxis response regulator CheY
MKRCMIVDDSDVIRKVAKRILESQDMLVVEAKSGCEALDLCAHDVPDIILVDAKLVDISAVDLVRMASANDKKPQIIICLTRFDIGAIMRAKRAGAQGYLLKPFNRAKLLQCLRQSFAAKRSAASELTAA